MTEPAQKQISLTDGQHDKANLIDYFGRKVNYSLGPYNKFDDQQQWIRISEGCPNQCPYCYEPKEFKIFPIPEIVRNEVKIMDMNLIAKPEAIAIINELAQKKVNGKIVNYELVCGVDHRFLTLNIAEALKAARFKKIRIAWDFGFSMQRDLKKAVFMLFKAGYKPTNVMVYMICNWRIPYAEELKKLDLCKVWGVQVADCYYDNQLSPNIIPIFWTHDQIKDFRHRCRKHNQLVNFKIDPEEKVPR